MMSYGCPGEVAGIVVFEGWRVKEHRAGSAVAWAVPYL
jgi:hypothetical protein